MARGDAGLSAIYSIGPTGQSKHAAQPANLTPAIGSPEATTNSSPRNTTILTQLNQEGVVDQLGVAVSVVPNLDPASGGQGGGLETGPDSFLQDP